MQSLIYDKLPAKRVVGSLVEALKKKTRERWREAGGRLVEEEQNRRIGREIIEWWQTGRQTDRQTEKHLPEMKESDYA